MKAAKRRKDCYPDDILETIGANIRRFRKAKGWSQNRLASVADLDRTYISYVENAHYNITIKALCQLAEALEVSVVDLIVADQ